MRVDTNMIKIRQDFDMGALKRQIAGKLDSTSFTNFKDEVEERLATLDSSFLLVGTDLETLQKVINRMSKRILEL